MVRVLVESIIQTNVTLSVTLAAVSNEPVNLRPG
jgi:hypothetical protein